MNPFNRLIIFGGIGIVLLLFIIVYNLFLKPKPFNSDVLGSGTMEIKGVPSHIQLNSGDPFQIQK